MSPEEASVATLVVAYVAAAVNFVGIATAGFVAWWSIHNRRTADVRSEWWRRIQYAMEQCYSDDPDRRDMGLEMLTMLSAGTTQGSSLEDGPSGRGQVKKEKIWIATKEDQRFSARLLESVVNSVALAPTRGAQGAPSVTRKLVGRLHWRKQEE